MQAIIRNAQHCMNIFIDGNHPLDQAVSFFENSDPLLVYFIVRFMRENKKVCGSGTRHRLVQFLSVYPHLQEKLAQTPKDSMVEWFNDCFSIQSFNSSSEYLNLIINKIEG